MINADNLSSDSWPAASYHFGPYVKAKPLAGPLSWRLRDAWAVLCGRAEAVCFTDPMEAQRDAR
jgi:hypothetical protein